jgi:hypothetical protein
VSPILELPVRIAALPPSQRARVEAMYAIELAHGHTAPPPQMDAWLQDHFGSVDAVREQSIIRILNRWTLDGSLFSPLRGRRPVESGRREAYQKLVEQSRGDPFCDPESHTPADTWGRVRGRHAISGANAAMYDGHHGVLVFAKHDPLAFDHDHVVEMLHLGREWAERSREEDPDAVNYLMIWNSGPRAGGSVIHGHAQMVLGTGMHYAQVERLRRDAAAYRAHTGADYFMDLASVHRDLGLAAGAFGEVTVIASLTPVKEREVLIIGAAGMDERDPAFTEAVAGTAIAFRDELEVTAFNMALHRPPLQLDAAGVTRWAGFPPVVHLVDRGNPSSVSSDIGAMELYGAAVVGVDPYEVVERLRASLAEG